jgi:hypothetical protein
VEEDEDVVEVDVAEEEDSLGFVETSTRLLSVESRLGDAEMGCNLFMVRMLVGSDSEVEDEELQIG